MNFKCDICARYLLDVNDTFRCAGKNEHRLIIVNILDAYSIHDVL